LLLAAGCAKKPGAHSDPLSSITWDDTPLDWTRPIPPTPVGGVLEAGYVGSDACQPCHAKLHASYAGHSMARTGLRALGTLDAKWLARIFDAGAQAPVKHARSGYTYRPVRQGDRYFIEEKSDTTTWLQPITHTLSAGSYGLSFYFRQGNRLYHTPLDYFAKRERWDLDPAAGNGNPRFGNAIGTFCISCHSDYPRRLAASDDAFLDPLPAGVGCERCHGPGQKHAESTLKEDIVNPARLPALKRLDVCTQCHQSSASGLRADRHDFSFRPGEAMDAYRVNFVSEPVEPDRFRLLAHNERMVKSACFRASAGKLGCTTCHDPHKSSFSQPATWWDGKCAGCHDTPGHVCTEDPKARAAKNDRCVTCHMRAGAPYDVPLVTVTDHFIQRRPPPIKPGAPEAPKRLVAWSAVIGEAASGADFPAVEAAALGKAGLDDQALTLLPTALASRPRVPQLYDWLTSQYKKRGQIDNARRAQAAILRFDPNARTLLSFALGQLDAGRPQIATQALDRLLAIDPDDPDTLEIKGMLLFRSGAVEQARPLLVRAAALGPMAVRSHVALAALALREGKRAEAIVELEAARRIEPRDAWILEKLAERAPKVQGATTTTASNWLPASWR
jgi:hypothetical protein